MQIGYRFDSDERKWSYVGLKPGMIIAGKWTNGAYEDPGLGYFGDFSYVVHDIIKSGVYTRDTGHNNWIFISRDELDGYELVMQWHPNNEDIEADDINKALAFPDTADEAKPKEKKMGKEIWDSLDRIMAMSAMGASATSHEAAKRGRALEAVAEAARGIGMNWKLGAPYGQDALDEALEALDRVDE